MYPIHTVPADTDTGVGNVKSTHPHARPAEIVTWFDTPSNAPGFPPESAYNTARTGCDPDAAPKPDTYPVSLNTLAACGAVYLDTSFKLTDAVSIDAPTVDVPNVELPPVNTVIVTGALVDDAPWLSVTLNTALYVPAAEYVNDGFCAVESPNVPSPFKSHEYEIVSPTSGSDDPDPSKLTVNGADPLVGDPDATATGGLFVPAYLISRIVPVRSE
jgi:hypothetical protein